MWRSVASACMVLVVGVCTVTTHGAAVLFGNESVVSVPADVMTQLVEIAESLCHVMPELVGCGTVNDTLFRGRSSRNLEGCGAVNYTLLPELQHERSDVPEYELSASNPLLSLALNHFSSIQNQNRVLVERDALHTAQLATLQQEKARLEEHLATLEGQRGYVRTIRDTQVTMLSPVEESTSDIGTLFVPPLDQHKVTADTLRPVDCSDHLVMGHTVSGVYDIYPFRNYGQYQPNVCCGSKLQRLGHEDLFRALESPLYYWKERCRCSKPVKVWCDMETDGGGWTVFLSRMNITPRENFNRTWNDYREGFGNATGQYWLGNEVLFTMTSSRAYTLRMDFRLTDGNLKWGEWPVFKVWNEKQKYKLEIPQYNGLSMIDHCFSLHNNRFFSTYDYDNDGNAAKNCALDTNGGWWYNNCGTVDPTKPYTPGGELKTTCPYKVHNKKIPLGGPWLQLKIRPAICDEAVKAVYFNGYTCHEHNN